MKILKTLKLRNLQNYTLEPVSYYIKSFDNTYRGMSMHHHQYFEIMYAHSGSFTLEIFKENESPKLKTFSIQPGQIIILDSFTFHRIVIPPHNFLPNLASLIRNSRRNHITKFLMPSKYQITFSFANSYSISLHYETYRKKY